MGIVGAGVAVLVSQVVLAIGVLPGVDQGAASRSGRPTGPAGCDRGRS